uniref:ARAD1D32604p n=1 Tax=Blastobotrys adeninivorans TaxID=409370 RepID=A0A060TB67_BLAAD
MTDETHVPDVEMGQDPGNEPSDVMAGEDAGADATRQSGDEGSPREGDSSAGGNDQAGDQNKDQGNDNDANDNDGDMSDEGNGNKEGDDENDADIDWPKDNEQVPGDDAVGEFNEDPGSDSMLNSKSDSSVPSLRTSVEKDPVQGDKQSEQGQDEDQDQEKEEEKDDDAKDEEKKDSQDDQGEEQEQEQEQEDDNDKNQETEVKREQSAAQSPPVNGESKNAPGEETNGAGDGDGDVVMAEKHEPHEALPPHVQQTHEIVIPSYAMWFNMNKIHSIEERSLPEFFNSRNKSKTPQVYKRYRDFMVNVYRLNPSEYLTLTACRRNLSGDVCAIMRIHSFLEKWGLINYMVDPEQRPAGVAPPFTGHWRPTLDTPRGLFPFQFYKGLNDPAHLPKTEEGAKADAITGDASGASGEQDTNESSQPSQDQDTNVKRESDDGWTDQEVLKLLEGIEKTPNDWSAIAEYVGSNKTREQCIHRFLTLSIEDRYLENGATTGSKRKRNDLGPLKYDLSNIPLSQAENPVMSVVSFLAGLVDPEVVAAAAGRSVEEIRRRQTDKIKDAESKEGKEGAEEGEKESTDAVKQEPNEPNLQAVSEVALGAMAARSQVLSTNTERLMYSQFTKLVQLQLQKIDTKLSKFAKLERNLEIERRELEKDREDLFLSRLALHRKVRMVDGILSRAMDSAQAGDLQKSKAEVEEAARISREATTRLNVSGPSEPDVADDMKPLSQEIPQTYKFWSA